MTLTQQPPIPRFFKKLVADLGASAKIKADFLGAKANFLGVFNGKLEEEVGFEPTVPCGTPDFESGTFGHSATLPCAFSAPAYILAAQNESLTLQVSQLSQVFSAWQAAKFIRSAGRYLSCLADE